MKRQHLSLQPFHIPTSCRQPRSQGSRQRPSRLCTEGCTITSTSDATSDDVIHNPVSSQGEADNSSVQCSISLDAGHEGTTIQPAQVESAAKNPLLATYLRRAVSDNLLNLSGPHVIGPPLSSPSAERKKQQPKEELQPRNKELICRRDQRRGRNCKPLPRETETILHRKSLSPQISHYTTEVQMALNKYLQGHPSIIQMGRRRNPSNESFEYYRCDVVGPNPNLIIRNGQNISCTGQLNRGHLLPNLTGEPLSATPTKSMLKVTGSPSSQIAPGSVVWAKIGYEWWPAEVMDRRAALEHSNNECDERLVLIQLYGVYEYAWVNPVNNLLHFDHCYEERSKDTSKAFQEALNQALRRKETASSSEQSDEVSDNWNMVSCCKTNDDPTDEGKGKRKRKPKVHFDDLTIPDNSVRKMRRMKIMRYLGLTAPVGSPFSRPHARRRTS